MSKDSIKKPNLNAILGGGMKTLINDVEKQEAAKAAVNQNNELGLYSFSQEDFERNVDYFFRTKRDKKPVYVDVEILKLLEELQYKIKYQGGEQKFVPLGSLISSILKTFFDVYKSNQE